MKPNIDRDNLATGQPTFCLVCEYINRAIKVLSVSFIDSGAVKRIPRLDCKIFRPIGKFRNSKTTLNRLSPPTPDRSCPQTKYLSECISASELFFKFPRLYNQTHWRV